MSKLVKKVPMEMEGYISLRDFIFVNVCVRYKGTKCKSQKVTLSAPKNVAQNECALRYWVSVRLKMNWRKHTPLYQKDTNLTKIVQWRLLRKKKVERISGLDKHIYFVLLTIELKVSLSYISIYKYILVIFVKIVLIWKTFSGGFNIGLLFIFNNNFSNFQFFNFWKRHATLK